MLPKPTTQGGDSSSRVVVQKVENVSLANTEGSEHARRRLQLQERRAQKEMEDNEIIPATESEYSSSSDEDTIASNPRRSTPPSNPFQSSSNPIASSSSNPIIIDLVSTPRAKPRRGARPTELFGSYTTTPLASSSSIMNASSSVNNIPPTPASPFIDITDSPSGMPQRRKKCKGPRPTELFQFITREGRKNGGEVEVASTMVGSGEEEVAVLLGDGKEGSSSVEKKKKRKEERVERRKSGKGCWVGEAVEEVRAVEREGEGEEGRGEGSLGDGEGEGVLTMLDEEELMDL